MPRCMAINIIFRWQWSLSKITIIYARIYNLPWYGVFDPDYSTWYKIPSCGISLKSNQNTISYLVTPLALLHPWAHLSRQVGIAAGIIQDYVRPLLSFPPQQPAELPLALWELANRNQVSWSVWNLIPYLLQLKCVVCPAKKAYLLLVSTPTFWESYLSWYTDTKNSPGT